MCRLVQYNGTVNNGCRHSVHEDTHPETQAQQGLHGVQVHLQGKNAKGYMVCRYTFRARMPRVTWCAGTPSKREGQGLHGV